MIEKSSKKPGKKCYNIRIQITDQGDELFYTQTDSILTYLIFVGEKSSLTS